MTVKTESSAAAFNDANMPPANITMAGTVFKSFIYQSPYNKKETIAVPETLLDRKIQRPWKGNEL